MRGILVGGKCLGMMLTEGLMRKVTFEQRYETRVSHVHVVYGGRA